LLKIDLLPAHFRVARVNKVVIGVMIVILLVTLGIWGSAAVAIKGKIARTEAELTKVKDTADKVRKIEGETKQKQSELQPIDDKLDFADKADHSGEQFWDRFHAINKYIYDKAQVTQFAISPPSTVSFEVTVGDTTECARFVLNLIRCKALSQVSISGLPAGVSVAGVGGAGGTVSFSPQAAGMEEGMAAEEPGMMAGEGFGAPSSGPTTGGAAQEINLKVAAQLVEPVEEPLPPGAGAAGGAPGAGPGGFGPGMPGEGLPAEGPEPGAAPGEPPAGEAAPEPGGGQQGPP